MFEIILAISSSAILIFISLYLFLKERDAANAIFSCMLMLLGFNELAGQAWLHLNNAGAGYERIGFIAESLLPPALLLFGFTYARAAVRSSFNFVKFLAVAASAVFPVAALSIPVENFIYAPDLETEGMLFLGNLGYWYYMGILLCCIIALVSLEAIFSAARGTAKRKLKVEFMGIGSILAVLIFYFSQGLLYRTINMNLIPVKSGIFLVASMMIGYSRLSAGSSPKVFLSRYVVYRSLTLLFIGIYFIFLGVLGEGMKYFDAVFSRDIAIFIIFASGIAMAALLLSEPLRRRMKVLINKHFYAHKYDYREEWLKFSGLLAGCRTLSDVQDVMLSTFERTFGLKGASLYLSDKDGRFILAANHDMMPVRVLQISDGLAAYFKERGRVLNPLDGEYAPAEFESDFLDTTGACLIVPLIANEKINGLVLFGEQLAPEKFIYEDFDFIKNIATQAALSVANFRLSEELAESREMAAVAKISSFIIHDLKNRAYSLSLLLENSEAYMEDAEFQRDMIDTVRNTVTSMKKMIEKLKAVPEKKSLNTVLSDLGSLTNSTVEELKYYKRNYNIECAAYPAHALIDSEEIKKVIVNLVLNAFDATTDNGSIAVSAGSEGELAFIRIEDNGCGMSPEYISGSLFRPFKSTKKSGLGIGLYQCRQIVEAHGGRIDVWSEPGTGSVFTVYLPHMTAMNQQSL